MKWFAPNISPTGRIVRALSEMWIALLILLITAALVLTGCNATRAGYESAHCQVVRPSGKFQVRDYPALTVVETRMAPVRNGLDGTLSHLFGFINGSNDA